MGNAELGWVHSSKNIILFHRHQQLPPARRNRGGFAAELGKTNAGDAQSPQDIVGERIGPLRQEVLTAAGLGTPHGPMAAILYSWTHAPITSADDCRVAPGPRECGRPRL